MSRSLPSRPHLEHLKAQAKDLLDAYRRAEPHAFNRIRAAVPAFARMSDEQLARTTFALHDAQSAIAREYGFVSWAELRTHVASASSSDAPAGDPADPSAAPTAAASGARDQVELLVASGKLTPEQADLVRAALARRGSDSHRPTPERVPMLPVRNAVIFPGGLAPLDISRPPSLRALGVVTASEPAWLAIFAQRAYETEAPALADLHTIGCLCIVRYAHTAAGGEKAWIIVEGVRWITLVALEQTEPYYAVRIADATVEPGDDAEIAALEARLRQIALKVAAMLPDVRDAAIELINTTQDIGKLADLVMASFPQPVADAASYARETQLTARLERVIAFLDEQLVKLTAPPAEPGSVPG